MIWWPQGIARDRLCAFVSSRLGRKLELWNAWFAALRTVILGMDLGDRMLVVDETAAGPFVDRAAQLFDRPILRLRLPDKGVDLDHWFQQIKSSSIGGEPSQRVREAFVSPPVKAEEVEPDVLNRDAIVFNVAHTIVALYVRPGGNIFGKLLSRLRSKEPHGSGTIRVCGGRGLTGGTVIRELMDAGAVGLQFTPTPESWNASVRVRSDRLGTACSAPVYDADETLPFAWLVAGSWSALLHCTRRCVGPWPDETMEDYLDSLILSTDEADHSALAALERITRTHTIRASAQAIRGGFCVVSLTSMTLDELSAARRYQIHRVRWDFEPYAVCISLEALRARGAREVVYGTERDWNQMPESERPFFQLQESTTRQGNRIDWRNEKEWRLHGDILLESLPASDVCLLVPSYDEARQLARISPWPIVVWRPNPARVLSAGPAQRKDQDSRRY